MHEKSLSGAVLLVFFAAVAGAMAPRPTEPPGKPYKAASSQQPQDTGLVPAIEQRPFSLNDAACKEKAQEPEYADLCQQWRMANAAERQTFWTMLEVVGLIGVLGLTFWTARAAQRSAKAAEAAIQSDRAWVVADGVNREIMDSADDGSVVECRVSVKWRNVGGTPARDLAMFSHIEELDVGDGVPTFPDEFGDAPTSVLGPGVALKTPDVRLSMAKMRGVLSGTRRIFIFSQVRYRDIYASTVRISEVCWEVVFGDLGGVDPFQREDLFKTLVAFEPVGSRQRAT